jgi:hypothetical protein
LTLYSQTGTVAGPRLVESVVVAILAPGHLDRRAGGALAGTVLLEPLDRLGSGHEVDGPPLPVVPPDLGLWRHAGRQLGGDHHGAGQQGRLVGGPEVALPVADLAGLRAGRDERRAVLGRRGPAVERGPRLRELVGAVPVGVEGRGVTGARPPVRAGAAADEQQRQQ